LFVRNQTHKPTKSKPHRLTACATLIFTLYSTSALASSFAPAGDTALRHDIQVLADHGVFKGPVTSWPLSWDALAADLNAADASKYPEGVRLTLQRVRARVERNTRRGESRFSGRLAVAEKPTAIRSFENTPREDAEIAAGFSWLGERVNVNLNVTAVDSPSDGEDVRADNSEIGISLGNFSYAISTMERWWGPGWDGSLILSNNARPIPSFVIRRNVTKPFETKWLNWLGPWDFRVIWGQMEKERVIPNTRFFGMRFNFKPHPSLEIGISRTAQWCGDGRPCGIDTFFDLFFGNDNVGDAGVTPENEAGNQLAGWDVRWSNNWFGTPMAFYGQLTGEDEAGGFPSRYLAQGGIEFSGWSYKRRWSYRWYAEVAGTSCDVLKSKTLFNCAYNHGIYQTGYRYRDRSVGHGADNDALIGTLGLVLVTENAHQFRALLRSGELNRDGGPDPRHTLTPTPLDLISLDLSYARPIGNSHIEVGIGFEELEDPTTSSKTNNTRAYLQWRLNAF
jgi:hypothetical protein